MKIGEYEQMMSYLTRPDTRTKLAGGTNPETGMGFQKGNTGFRTKDGEVRNVKGKNQYGPIRTLEEVQKAINDAPAITIKGKTFERNAKDLIADSSYVNKKEGGTQYITRKEFDEYKDELKFKASGPKNFSEETIKKARDKRRDFTKKRSSESLEKALAAPQKSKLNFHHAGFKESLTDLKNTMYIPGSPNRKMAKLFEDPLLKKMEAFTKIFDDPKATTKQKQKAATDYLKNDRSLRQKYPQFKNFKTRLSFRRTSLDPSGIMFKEKLPDPSLAISNEPGMTLKGETSKSPRGKEIIKKAAEKRAGELGFIDTDVLKDAGKFGKYLLQIAGTPLGVVGLTAGLGVDPTSSIDRSTLAAEAALAPALVKGTDAVTKNAALKKLLNLGMSPKMAMRAARIASPLGIASLGGEAVYQYGKFAKGEIEKLKNMEPDERKAYTEALMDEGGLLE
tara:strand:- start:647 stop:1996 length:1350 start_codon:yes stop_codon:yes gene_type:complete